MPTPQTDIYSHERAGFAERLGRLAGRTTWREPASGAFTDRADKMPLEHALATALAFARQAPHDIGPDIAYAVVTMIEHRRPRIVGELTARLRNDARRVAARAGPWLPIIAGKAYEGVVHGWDMPQITAPRLAKRDYALLYGIGIGALMHASEDAIRRAERCYRNTRAA